MTTRWRGWSCATCRSRACSSTRRRAPARTTPGSPWNSSSIASRQGSRPLPRRTDISTVCVIGSGPIVIGQACEFDYSGTQALRVLRDEGYTTVLINSNPATIMTDPGWADRTYLEPLDLDGVRAVLEAERPDALLPTLGGQTALNLASLLSEAGVLDELGIELIGASY